ncbi:MAG: hypothetical protein RMM29_09365 [Planctomycetota bacterium]|nr:hypothetical protein [Planctomycetota bacterium]MCX8040043.1 hypothetical protein [Planctomycetota bacterium]MDW8373837.1 hypothetical protein [Planctomycetota bacterium]
MQAAAQAGIAIVAALLALAGSAWYVRDTLRGRTRPHRVTWAIYAVVGVLVVASSWLAGGRWSLLTPLAYVVGPVAIAIASIRYGVGGWSRSDRLCLGGAAAATAGWLASGDPRVGVWMHTVVDICATIPTLRKAWYDPRHEHRGAWTLYALSSLLNLGSIDAWSVGAAVFPLWLALGCSGVAAILWWRHTGSSAGPSRPAHTPGGPSRQGFGEG